MMILYQQDGSVLLTDDSASPARTKTIPAGYDPVTLPAQFAAFFPPTPTAPQTQFSSLAFMQTLFTAAEQARFATAAQSNAQVLLFMLFVAGATAIDITNPQTIASINAVAQINGSDGKPLITAARAAQVLSGTAAPSA